jgi:hypothetical protein
MHPHSQHHPAHASTDRLVSRVDPSVKVSAHVESFERGGCLAESDLERAFAVLSGGRSTLSLPAVHNRLKLFFPDATREEASALMPVRDGGDGGAAAAAAATLTLEDVKLMLLENRLLGFDPFAEALRLFSERPVERDARYASAHAHDSAAAPPHAALSELRRVSEALAGLGGSAGAGRAAALSDAWEDAAALKAFLRDFDSDGDGRVGLEDARRAVGRAREAGAAAAKLPARRSGE